MFQNIYKYIIAGNNSFDLVYFKSINIKSFDATKIERLSLVWTIFVD